MKPREVMILVMIKVEQLIKLTFHKTQDLTFDYFKECFW